MRRWVRRLLGPSGPPIVPATGWSAPLTALAALAMAFLAVLALAAGLAAGRLAAEWERDLAGAATVRVPGLSDDEAALAARIEAILRETPGIAEARALTDDEQRALLVPWFGADPPLADLPVPRLIDVRVTGRGPDVAALQRRLDSEAPGAIYDDHDGWRRPLAEAASGLRRIAYGAMAAVVLAACAMVALAARATLAGNVEVIRTVRLVGGEDRFIAGAFIRRIAVRAFLGAAAGALLGLLMIGGLPDLAGSGVLGVPLLPGRFATAAMGLAVALGAAGVALVTAQVSIRLALRRIL